MSKYKEYLIGFGISTFLWLLLLSQVTIPEVIITEKHVCTSKLQS
jgi:hypothetical protein